MKTKFLTLCAIFCIALFGCITGSDTPATIATSVAIADTAFCEGVKLEANGEAIDVQVGHLVPAVADWNDDGKKDLLVGQFNGGKIALYLNQGTDAKPVFTGHKNLFAGGAEISLPAG